MQAVYDSIIKSLKEEEIDAHTDISGGDLILRVMPDRMGPDEDGMVVMEVCRVPIDDEYGHGYYQLFTTIAKDLPEEKYPTVLANLNEVNVSAVLGNYAVLSEHGMVYHKYVAKITEGTDEQTAKELLLVIFDVLGVIDNDFENVFLSLG